MVAFFASLGFAIGGIAIGNGVSDAGLKVENAAKILSETLSKKIDEGLVESWKLRLALNELPADLRKQLGHTIDEATRAVIPGAGAELRLTTRYAQEKLREELMTVAQLIALSKATTVKEVTEVFAQFKKLREENPPKPFIGNFGPQCLKIEVDQAGKPTSSQHLITFSGYNFCKPDGTQRKVTFEVLDAEQKVLRDVSKYAIVNTDFLITVNVSPGSGLPVHPGDAMLRLSLEDTSPITLHVTFDKPKLPGIPEIGGYWSILRASEDQGNGMILRPAPEVLAQMPPEKRFPLLNNPNINLPLHHSKSAAHECYIKLDGDKITVRNEFKKEAEGEWAKDRRSVYVKTWDLHGVLSNNNKEIYWVKKLGDPVNLENRWVIR